MAVTTFAELFEREWDGWIRDWLVSALPAEIRDELEAHDDEESDPWLINAYGAAFLALEADEDGCVAAADERIVAPFIEALKAEMRFLRDGQ